MSNSRTFNVKRNIWSGLINKVITLGFPFLIRTIIIFRFGAEYLGLNSLFSAILQVLNMAELGFSTAITFRMYKPMAEGDTVTICALMALYRKVYRVVGLSILGIGALLIPFLKYFIKGTWPDEINIYVLYLIYLINTSISYLFFAYKNVLLNVSQRQDIISRVDTILVIIRSIIQMAMLVFFSDYYLYIVWNPIIVLINNYIIAAITNRRFPYYVCKGRLPDDDIREIMKKIKGLAIGKVGLVSRNSFDSIVLSMFLGLVHVAIYSNYYFVLNAVLGIIMIVTQSMIASVGNSIVKETKEKNYSDFIRFNFYFSWIGSWCTICMLCLYQPFMEIWAGEQLMAPFETVILFCVYFYISQMGQVRAVYSSASGIWWEFRFLQIGEMFSNLILNFGLGYLFGLNGIIVSTIITVLLFSTVGAGKKTMNIYFQKSSKEYFENCIVYAGITLIAGMVTYLLCSIITDCIGLVLIKRLVICCVIPNLIFGIFAIKNKKRKEYLQQFINIVKTVR